MNQISESILSQICSVVWHAIPLFRSEFWALYATMGSKNKGPIVIIVNKEWQCSHHLAFADLEKSGLLSQASHEMPVVGAFVAPSAAHEMLGGRPQVLAYRKRARSELEDQRLLEFKRLRVHMDQFQW